MKTLNEEKIKSCSREEILEAVKNNRYTLSIALPIFQDDAEIVRAAISLETLCASNMNGPIFKYASPRLRSKRNIVLEAVKNYGEAIEYASPCFYDDTEIVLTALKNSWVDTYPYGGSIIYACISHRLRGNSKVIEAMGFTKESNLLMRLMTSKEEKTKREEWWQEKYGEINKKCLEQWKNDVEEWENKIVQSKQEQEENQYKKYSVLRKRIEQMPIYERWRQDVINRCINKCQMCGINNNLEVHHRVSFYLLLKQYNITSIEKAFENKNLWNIDNGEVLCKECHNKMESSINRQTIILKNKL